MFSYLYYFVLFFHRNGKVPDKKENFGKDTTLTKRSALDITIFFIIVTK